jgi:hypothetical protein
MIGWVALWLWPVFSVFFFRLFSLPVAACVAIMGGYLLLPSGLELQLRGLPPIDKTTIVAVASLLLALVTVASLPDRDKWQLQKRWIPGSAVVLICLMALVIGEFGTVATNREPLVFGFRVIPGLTWRDAFSGIARTLLFLTPFFIGRMIFGSRKAQRALLVVLVGFALFYSVLALYEVRMSPQLHAQVYGFSPFSFIQQMRGGGFRPVVFLNHGLAVGIFLAISVLAAATLYRSTEGPERWKWALAMVWLLGVLVLSKSLGALLITLMLLPCILVLNPRQQMIAAVCIASVFLAFPVLRAAGLVPVDRALALAEQISPARAQSLGVRLDNEEILLARALEKPVFGWGGWGRARVYDQNGVDISITDGSWVIAFGDGGWTQYLGLFGLMCWPVFGLFLRHRQKVDPIAAGLVLILCAKLVDLIPNSGFSPINWLILGALAGRLELKNWDDRQQQEPAEARDTAGRREGTRQQTRRYARDFSKPALAADVPPRAGPSYKRSRPTKKTRT